MVKFAFNSNVRFSAFFNVLFELESDISVSLPTHLNCSLQNPNQHHNFQDDSMK